MKFTPTKFFDQAMLCILLLSLCSTFTGTAVGQSCTPGTWTEANQPPNTCRPYPSSLWNKQLPGAGNRGPLNHLAPSSDAIVQNPGNFLGTGTTYIAPPGAQDVTANPLYYGTASDGLWKITSCENPGHDSTHNPVGTYWHIPNNARYSGLNGDRFMSVWDQVSNKVLSAYPYPKVFDGGIGTCSATTQASACSFPTIYYCSMADYSTDKGYAAGNGAGDSLGEAPAALVIRVNEWMSGVIPHALYLNGSCEDPGTVFPGVNHAAACPDPPGPKPLHGALFFMDYTDAQVNAMGLPPWKKAIVLAMTHYGGYFGDTNDSAAPGHGDQGAYANRYEGGEAYLTSGLSYPLQSWLSGQSGVNGGVGSNQQINYWANIPNVVGPNCPTSTCGVLQHTHIADQCVPLGLAGKAGGCVDTSNTALAAPTGLTAIVQ